MPQFLLGYHGKIEPETQEDGQKMMGEWKDWAVSLGAALVNPGTPVGVTKVLTGNGVSSEPSPHPIMGFSILEADSMDKTIELLRDCPHLKYGGTLEVSEMMEMPG